MSKTLHREWRRRGGSCGPRVGSEKTRVRPRESRADVLEFPNVFRAPTAEELADLQFGWLVCKHVNSNAIVFAKGGSVVGVGAGQM
ncbi:MAG: hypothetical protein N2C14_17800, partial [Planctomycetales bacterium]